MRKPEDQLVLGNRESESIFEALGITEERGKQICKEVEDICKGAPDEGKNSDIIKQVWDKYENPNECALALYILRHDQEEVSVQECFGTEVVGEEEEEIQP